MKAQGRILIEAVTLACVLLALFVTECRAVCPYTPVHSDPVLEPWRWTVFPELRGFGLWCVAEDHDGNMWFGGRDGVRRYDGVNWTSFTEKDGLTPGLVLALRVTGDGSVYAGTYWGIDRFREGSWHRVFPQSGSLPLRCTDILEDSAGDLWASTLWGPLRLRGREAILYTASGLAESLRELLPDVAIEEVPDSAVPQRTWSDGLGAWRWRLAEGQILILPVMADSPAERAGLKAGDRIHSVNGDPEGSLSGPAGTTLMLTVEREGRADPIEVRVTIEEVQEWTCKNLDAYDLFEDREGALWIGLGYGEIVRWDVRARGHDDPDAWRLYTRDDGLDPGSWGPRILQGRDGTVWVVWRNEGGISRFDGEKWESFRIPEARRSHHNPSILQTRDGTVWIGGGLGLVHAYRDGEWTTYRRPALPVPSSDFIEGLLEASDGSLWIAGAEQEAVRLEYGTSRFQSYENLHFQCETPDRVQWFVSADSSVVRHEDETPPAGRQETWRRYGTEDGLMDHPFHLFATKEGVVWAVGHHAGKAAVARFQGGRWVLQVHPDLGWLPYSRQGLESFDGSLWLMASGGLLRYDGLDWILYPGPSVPDASETAQTLDGTIWAGNWSGLFYLEGDSWRRLEEPEELTGGISCLHVAGDSSLWVGTSGYGVLRYLAGRWTRYDVTNGLASNRVESVLQTDVGSIWVATDEGVSRFDGRTWTTYALPATLTGVLAGGTDLRRSHGGALWINTEVTDELALRGLRRRTIRYLPESGPPETEIKLSAEEVSQPGNTTLEWVGRDPWHSTPTEEIQFSYRLDDEEWTPFTQRTNAVLTSLVSGAHTFAVKARDRDFNEDPTPAVVHFTVVPPAWKQPWFIGLMAVLLSAIGLQTGRVIRRDRRLQASNDALADMNKELFQINRDLETANRRIQEQTERKSRFLASMSHELRTPMNAIIGFTRMVLRRAGDVLPQRQQENLVKVTVSADHLLDLINNILDLSKIEAGRMDVNVEPFDVKTLIAGCCAEVEPLVKPGVKLGYDASDDIGEADTDQARVRQIVINLLSNAVKFTEQGEVAMRATRESDSVVISVSDTGPGIPADALDMIFEEFQQVKGSDPQHKGTGLGLPITKGFAELLGGSISVQSEVGRGSTFTVRIPMVYRES